MIKVSVKCLSKAGRKNICAGLHDEKEVKADVEMRVLH